MPKPRKSPKGRSPAAPQPPRVYEEFVERFPEVAAAWQAMGDAARRAGPLTEREARLVKLAIAVGGMRVGAVRAAVRRARAEGVGDDAIEQVVALAASTIGVPAAVAAWTWTRSSSDG